MADIFEVGIVGSGIMGAGLAEVTARQIEWTVAELRGSIIGFRFPALTDPDFPAALVLYQRLAGDGGVLATDARFRQTLNSALAGYTVRGPLLVDAMPPAAEAVPYTAIHVQSAPDAIVQVQEALLRVLYEVRDTPSGEQALSRARRRAINALALAGLDQPGRARTLGEWALFARGWAPLQRLPESISRVTQADLTRVAQLLDESGLLDGGNPSLKKLIVTERFRESLLTATDERTVRELIRDRVELVESVSRSATENAPPAVASERGVSGATPPCSRDQSLPAASSPSDARAFVRAIT